MQPGASVTVSNTLLFLVVALASSLGIEISVLRDMRNVACLIPIIVSILMVVFVIGCKILRLLVLNFVD